MTIRTLGETRTPASIVRWMDKFVTDEAATTSTQEPDTELVGWIAEIDEQSALDAALALAMADVRAA